MRSALPIITRKQLDEMQLEGWFVAYISTHTVELSKGFTKRVYCVIA